MLWALGCLLLASPLIRILTGQHSSCADLLFVPYFAAAVAGAFVIHLGLRYRPREAALTMAFGVVLASFLHYASRRALHRSDNSIFNDVLLGVGFASLCVLSARALQARGNERGEVLSVLMPGVLLPAFIAASGLFLDMTAFLHPTVYDGLVAGADNLFGVQPSFLAGRFFSRFHVIGWICRIVYLHLPLAVSFVFMMRRRRAPQDEHDILLCFAALGVCGFLLYHLFPVVGPAYFFRESFPNGVPSISPHGSVFFKTSPRNCMPSLHTAWALLLFWYTRGLARWVRLFGLGWFLLTLLATLGFGFHYAMDLVVAVPFTLAVTAWGLTEASAARRQALCIGIILTVVWLLTLRFLATGGPATSLVRWLLAGITIVVSSRIAKGIALPPRMRAHSTGGFSQTATLCDRRARMVVSLVFVSGALALVYEIAFVKSLALAFGNSAGSLVIVVGTCMAGVALGVWLGGILGKRLRDPLGLHALSGGALGMYCVCSPWLSWAIRDHCFAFGGRLDSRLFMGVALQSGATALVIAPAMVLMGITLAVLAQSAVFRGNAGRALGHIYGTMSIGAAIGAALAGYALLPTFGVRTTLMLAGFGYLAAALLTLHLRKRETKQIADIHAPIPSEASDRAPIVAHSGSTLSAKILVAGGFVSFALETVHVHLLGVVAGTSVYACLSIVLASLVGFGLGTLVAHHWLRRHCACLWQIGGIELALAGTISVTAHGWAHIPGYFASFFRYPLARDFPGHEVVRFVVCTAMLFPNAFLAGGLIPLVLEIITRAAERQHATKEAARALVLNMASCAAGVAVTALWLIPRLGSLNALRLLAGFALILGLLPFFWLGQRIRWTLAALGISVVLLGLPQELDYDRLSAGSCAYFNPSIRGHVVAHAESLNSGLVAITESSSPGDKRVLTLLKNGQYQGDDGTDVAAERAFALYPLLHTKRRDRALVIGLGTGVSGATLLESGFSRLDVVEQSREVAQLTGGYFGSANGRVLSRSGLHLHITEARSFLLRFHSSYDLISIDIPSIWLTETASHYNKEFYELARTRLKDEGVLEQRLPLHHLSSANIVTIVNSLRGALKFVSLYVSGSQGILVGRSRPCPITAETRTALGETPGSRASLISIGVTVADLERSLFLVDRQLERFLAASAGETHGGARLISTDDNQMLEYDTPRGNVRGYRASLAANLGLIGSFSGSHQ